MKLFSKPFLLLLLILVLSCVGLGFLATRQIYLSDSTRNIQNLFASVFFSQSVTVSGLQQKYNSGQKIKILVVPGHEPDFGGTEYKGIKEHEMTLQLARTLVDQLKADGHYDVVMSRDENGWNPVLENYFSNNWQGIQDFYKNKKSEMAELVSAGKVEKLTAPVAHGKAPNDVAIRLFGINKWANENNVDVMVHIHFNNYYRAHLSKPGAFTGFAMYVPDGQYSNAAATHVLAGKVFSELAQSFSVSTAPREHIGIIDDQQLIALGQSNTADGASMLIEYGYIYEPQFADPTNRKIVLDSMAHQTYLGIRDFFNTSQWLTRGN